MKAVIQRVRSAKVSVNGELISEIGSGLLTLLGVHEADTEKDAEWLMRKIIALRIFDDAEGKMNLSLQDVGGSHLIVSQFTLWGDTRKGNRPSFQAAARPDPARALYESCLRLSLEAGVPTWGGKFQAHMNVSLENDGPVTLILDSRSDAN